jgi:hypothetical protein
VRKLLALLCFIFSTGLAQAQSFSADLAITGPAGAAKGTSGKVFVGNGKIRIETADFPDGFFVVDPGQKTAYFVRPARSIFMDAKQSTPLTQLLVPVDPADPCAQWQAMAEIAGLSDLGRTWQCRSLGEEAIDDRPVRKYQLEMPRGNVTTVWIDPQVRFVSRIRNADGSGIDLRALHAAPQSETLFAIPANYAKFDPRRLIERLKQSDVWVERAR